MTRRLELRPAARRDLLRFEAFLKKMSVKAADRRMDWLQRELRALETNPLRGQSRDRRRFQLVLRYARASYVVRYTLTREPSHRHAHLARQGEPPPVAPRSGLTPSRRCASVARPNIGGTPTRGKRHLHRCAMGDAGGGGRRALPSRAPPARREKVARDTDCGRLKWQRARAFAAARGGVTERQSAVDASEELAKKGQQVRELTLEMDLLKCDVDAIAAAMRMRGMAVPTSLAEDHAEFSAGDSNQT